jgi:hypothetical protein
MTAKPSGQKPVAARSGRFCRRQKTFDVYRDRQGRICRRLFRPRGGGRSQGGCRGAPDRRQRHARGDAGNRRRIPPRTWRRCAVLGQVNSRIGKKSSSMARRGAPASRRANLMRRARSRRLSLSVAHFQERIKVMCDNRFTLPDCGSHSSPTHSRDGVQASLFRLRVSPTPPSRHQHQDGVHGSELASRHWSRSRRWRRRGYMVIPDNRAHW